MKRISAMFIGCIAALVGAMTFNTQAYAENGPIRHSQAVIDYEPAGFTLHFGHKYGHHGHRRHGYHRYGPYRHFGKHRWYGKHHHPFWEHRFRHRYFHHYKPRHHHFYKRHWGHRYRHHYRPGYRFFFSF